MYKKGIMLFLSGFAMVLLFYACSSTEQQVDEVKPAVVDARGRTLGLSCTGCHGTDGNSPGSIPSINGKPSTYIALKLMAFKSGDESSTVMGRLAKGYTDEEIGLIAEYYAGLKK